MDDDLIVVDDVEPTPKHEGQSRRAMASDRASSRRSLRRASVATSMAELSDPEDTPGPSERPMRSAVKGKGGAAPKLKLKLGEKTAAQAPGMSFLGAYDRELDSDDEDLSFEEQFVLRLPPGEDCDKLRKMVAAREISNDVWFKFKDSRRAVFHIGNNLYSAKLVDLPCIVEAQKTLDNKAMFKVADICQMLVVEEKVQEESEVVSQRNLNLDEYIWPHGVTPPLKHVRKRRFRKRVNRRTIESVEEEVERLLAEDAMATEVKYEVLENVNPDLSDSEFMEQEVPLDAPTPAISDLGEAATPGGDMGEEYHDEQEDEEEPDGDIDEELAAELDLALENEDENDGDDDDDSEEEDDDEDEDDEDAQARQLLNEEIGDLQAAIAKKQSEIASSANPLIRKRFEDALKKLNADLELKVSHRDEMREKQRLKKEGLQPGDQNGAQGNANRGQGDEDDEDEADLFGDDDEMEIG
ncbi:TAFII55 protein conserved region-domain-containing protein [Coprinopsis sp. MPI-PUGE-AT-0042]|nr:TAFII55 protein conserved region-domain-containing protein [Coprinopsis sp. MPI-PUGE-AT-0042]